MKTSPTLSAIIVSMLSVASIPNIGSGVGAIPAKSQARSLGDYSIVACEGASYFTCEGCACSPYDVDPWDEGVLVVIEDEDFSVTGSVHIQHGSCTENQAGPGCVPATEPTCQITWDFQAIYAGDFHWQNLQDGCYNVTAGTRNNQSQVPKVGQCGYPTFATNGDSTFTAGTCASPGGGLGSIKFGFTCGGCE